LSVRDAALWALGSSGNIESFRVLGGIESLTILAERCPASAKAVDACGRRWRAAGREVRQSADQRQGLKRRLAGHRMSDIAAYSTTEGFKPSAIAPKGNAAPKKRPVVFKSASAFCAEYVPLSYTVEGIIRSASLYTDTAPTGAGKTAFNVVAALAVATGRADILGLDVASGRVAYLACENPDDIRMRIMIGAYLLNINIAEISDRLVILDRHEKPEAVHAELSRLARAEPFALILIDTLAGFFDGDNIDDAVQGGQFMRRLRPLTQIKGLPAS
jgi:hypothetical protein